MTWRPAFIIFICSVWILSCGKREIPEPSWSFFVAGHTYGQVGGSNVGLYPLFLSFFPMIETFPGMSFGVLTGDAVRNSDAQHFDSLDAQISKFGFPVHIAPGNHDVANRNLFESRYGSPFRSFRMRSDLVLILDSNADSNNISGEQLEFLRDELSEYNESGNVFVFFHHMLWWRADNAYRKLRPNTDDNLSPGINFWSEVMPLFEAMPGKVIIFCGDLGAYSWNTPFMFHQFGNITLIGSGMGGGVKDNFVIVTVDESNHVSFELIAMNGSDPDALGELEDYVLP